ncbi:MAG: GntR family transcriptional regulator [Gammaproteobacteria bacterium]|nr:GntR family transcriptional regulator [Gammaproteobacteria bacterium]
MTRSQPVYAALRQKIRNGELPPGHYLVETDLARALGVSRTPVREAIRRLAAEGLVQRQDRRRAIVREFPPQATKELFEIRARLEGYAAYRAATRLDAETLAELDRLATAMERCAARGDDAAAGEFADLNDRFHGRIAAAAESSCLQQILAPALEIQLVLLQRFRPQLREHLERSCWHHRELLRAFALRDPLLAEQQMQLHLRAAGAG